MHKKRSLYIIGVVVIIVYAFLSISMVGEVSPYQWYFDKGYEKIPMQTSPATIEQKEFGDLINGGLVIGETDIFGNRVKYLFRNVKNGSSNYATIIWPYDDPGYWLLKVGRPEKSPVRETKLYGTEYNGIKDIVLFIWD